ncbi:hypothetical protein GCM10011316_28240 [Roseibium aquae]|uniref:DUF2497 domain-containing protein n=1 Tax=Roseibium aquae TaxID=1323746 RepID=A0A916TL91_9HYPH|nr:DUF2497 domain-containing protein [Roseibium aquae]GGB54534.1 hypothetical protein GCM10011316_28240 [Roseibium aquae]
MAEAKQAEEPSMEEILASIRRIISDEDAQKDSNGDDKPAGSANVSSPDIAKSEAEDDMGASEEMSQDDLDKLFDMDGPDEDLEDDADEMAAAMAEDALDDVGGDDDVLELTEDLALSEDDIAGDEMDLIGGLPQDLSDEDMEIGFKEEEPEEILAVEPPEPEDEPDFAPAAMTRPVPDRPYQRLAEDEPLISAHTGDKVHAALDSLSGMLIGGNAQTMEELIQDMLRPMLKAWLDENLPGMVEQMVQKEIKRMMRRR